MLVKLITGVILQPAFTHEDPKSKQKDTKDTVFLRFWDLHV